MFSNGGKWKAGRRGYCGSELIQTGGAGSSRGSRAKPSVQRSRHYADLPIAGDGGVAGRMKNGMEC